MTRHGRSIHRVLVKCIPEGVILKDMEVFRFIHRRKHAVVSGAAGATLGGETVVILGIANLIADGFSMGASSFLSIRTEEDVRRTNGLLRRRRQKNLKALRRSLVTFGAFVVAGAMPLAPFVYDVTGSSVFLVSAVAAGCTFFVVGGARTIVTKRGFFTSGLEMLTIGGIAATLAYSIGYGVHALIS